MASYDLVLAGGEVIDPATNTRGLMDVAFRDGTVAAVRAGIRPDEAERVVDVSGKLVVPGLVDIHTHFYYGVSSLCRDPRTELLPTGLTCAVDAGTSGSANFFNLRDFIIEPSPLNLYAFLNIAALGMLHWRYTKATQFEMANVDTCAKTIERNRDTIVGIKVHLPGTHSAAVETSKELLQRTVEAGDRAGVPVMVHIDGGLALEEVLAILRPGDIVTHAFQGHEPTLVGDNGRLRDAVHAAMRRGVLLDLAPAGRNHFSWRIVEAAASEGVYPSIIASDYATAPRNGPPGFMRTLPEVMSMMLDIGMPLEDTVRAATTGPAAAIGRADKHGSLAAGVTGDATVLDLRQTEEAFYDQDGTSRTLRNVLAPTAVVRKGCIAWTADA